MYTGIEDKKILRFVEIFKKNKIMARKVVKIQ